jgi:hypothetical protein
MGTQNPRELLKRLLKEPRESNWLEFKHNYNEPELVPLRITRFACEQFMAHAAKSSSYGR